MRTGLNGSISSDPRWARIVARDKTADGLFWYVVATTGIYCRPSCPSRTANPRNVTIHDSLESARATGARPCRRCNPEGSSIDAENAAIVERACRTIEAAERAPSLSELADAAELSPGYFHRLFKGIVGLTPRAYSMAHRAGRVRDGLREARSVTAAIYEAGFGSGSRFYEGSTALLGMKPSTYRAGGKRERLCFAIGQCSLGAILVASSDKGVAAILLGDDPDALARDLQNRFPHAELVGGDGEYETFIARVIGFVEAPGIGLDLPLDVRGTAFQQRVWQALREVPAGKTVTYAEIARRIGAPAATRAVAGACAANHIAVAIPCHRVIRNDGALSGYRWGVERKRRLLDRESAA
ncbi:MAG TPA: bifunctional DNA-binding transcriptional regulator/O6-methylguanine-DNA methyltransferase Ada [Sphingomonas sp.]|nr:bifunctional DNA-binding transcriptional regulator/O6-methylguanine-DNA methyltransferase Ada [Sphingomonas sp.]